MTSSSCRSTTTTWNGVGPACTGSAASAKTHRVVHYDSRGQGLSTRGLTDDLVIDDYRTDLEAVIEAVGVERFAVVGYGGFGHIALRYAAENPGRVRAVILICTCESFLSWPVSGMLAMAEENWDLFLDLENANLPAEMRGRVVAAYKTGTTQPDYVRMVRAFSSSTITDLIGQIEAPILGLHSLDQHWLSVDEGMRLGTRLGARVVLLNGPLEPTPLRGWKRSSSSSRTSRAIRLRRWSAAAPRELPRRTSRTASGRSCDCSQRVGRREKSPRSWH